MTGDAPPPLTPAAPPTLDEATRPAPARFRRTLQPREAGITPQQHQLLLAIRGAPRPYLSVGELARELMVAPPTAAGLVERAGAPGLVQKQEDPDRRRGRVQLNPQGRERIARLTAAHRGELLRLWRRIPPLG
jgi:DNA-binding MarR family transcriptional regulator